MKKIKVFNLNSDKISMKTIIVLISFIFSLSVSAQSKNGIEELFKVCLDQKQTLPSCQEIQNIERNIQYKTESFISNYNLQYPTSLVGFVIKPEIRINKDKHSIKIKPQSVSYSFDF